MRLALTRRVSDLGIGVLAVAAAVALLAQPMAGQSSGLSIREAEGARQLKGAIDMHFHLEAATPKESPPVAHSIDVVRRAYSQGMRGLVIKHHWEPTGTVAYLLRKEIPGFEIFGGIVMNPTNGGENPAAVDFMGTQIAGYPGQIVWMPTDSDIQARNSGDPNRLFTPVTRNGELLPETKAVIAMIVKDNLVLASGHISPEDALLVFAEGRKQGVHRMIETHAMDLAGKMNLEQMQEAAKLGAILEFDFRNILSENGRRADAIRKIGPEHCLISEFWTGRQPVEYAGFDGVGQFVDAMHARGFTDHELDVMFKENPARLLGLPIL
jgi:hypothetical protein